MTPDEWGAKYRRYPSSAGVPGPRDPFLTPYGVPVGRAVAERVYKRVVFVVSSQSGKTETILDVIGQRMDTSPVPIIYVGPNKQFLGEQFEPRLKELIDSCEQLSRKLTRGREEKKTLKKISGIPIRLAHGGSSAALKSDPFGLAITDEVEEMVANLRGAGNPVRLIDARGETYADFCHFIVSTPGVGPLDVERDPESGLEFWAVDISADIESAVWRLWQSGTRHHWAWPCPHCGEYFIPRLKQLKWEKPKDEDGKDLPSDPDMARRTAYMECPTNGCVIEQHHKEAMNAAGVYVAPGQSVASDGTVTGLPPDSWTISFWASGLCSPFRTWGDRAQAFVSAVRSGDQEEVKTVLNANFGELYAPGGGEVPAWKEVAELRSPAYLASTPERPMPLPSGIKHLTMTVDVQKNRLYYTIRGWGAYGASWLISADEIYGDTATDTPWDILEAMLQDHYGADAEQGWKGMPIRLALIDSGFRPGKKDTLPVNRIYEFCRRNSRVCRATKGSSAKMSRPIMSNAIDINSNGKILHKALDLYRLDTDFFKSWVHERVRFDPEKKGAWLLPADVSDDYCMQIVSEARIKKPSGEVTWVQRAKDNHFLDCEAMQAAAGLMTNAFKLREDSASDMLEIETFKKSSNGSSQTWIPRESIW